MNMHLACHGPFAAAEAASGLPPATYAPFALLALHKQYPTAERETAEICAGQLSHTKALRHQFTILGAQTI
jgi:hypothetical protein